MNSNTIHILEFPTNLGLKKAESEVEPGVKKLPDWLKKHQFHKQLGVDNVLRIAPPVYSMDLDRESGVRNAERIISFAKEQSEVLLESLEDDAFHIILGGDCSVLIGNAIALKQKGNFGLFFLDGHTDFITPEISDTAGAAGMDLAIVTGYGHKKLTDIQNLRPYFNETNIFCVGNREYDREYVQAISKSEIHYFDLNKLRLIGLKKIANQFLKLIEKNNLDGFFIHLDVDVLNDDIMPAVDSRQAGGLLYEELYELMVPLLSSKKAVGIEITILNPDLDEEGEYTVEFIKNFVAIIETAKTR